MLDTSSERSLLSRDRWERIRTYTWKQTSNGIEPSTILVIYCRSKRSYLSKTMLVSVNWELILINVGSVTTRSNTTAERCMTPASPLETTTATPNLWRPQQRHLVSAEKNRLSIVCGKRLAKLWMRFKTILVSWPASALALTLPPSNTVMTSPTKPTRTTVDRLEFLVAVFHLLCIAIVYMEDCGYYQQRTN